MQTATRQIGIDMGHRVTNHASKCRNVHGHRYTIEVTAAGALVESGPSEGMVHDFGFLKDLMMKEIDAPCDHGLCLWERDPLLIASVFPRRDTTGRDGWDEDMKARGCHSTEWAGGKLYILGVVPTAENLAKHWFMRLTAALRQSSLDVVIQKVRVWETPNCYAEYSL